MIHAPIPALAMDNSGSGWSAKHTEQRQCWLTLPTHRHSGQYYIKQYIQTNKKCIYSLSIVYITFLPAPRLCWPTSKDYYYYYYYLKRSAVQDRESGIHPISPKTPAPQYQPIDRKKRKGKKVEDYSRDRAA